MSCEVAPLASPPPLAKSVQAVARRGVHRTPCSKGPHVLPVHPWLPNRAVRLVRTCPHGQITSVCAKCAPRHRSDHRRRADAAVQPPSEEHAGYEIFFEPAVSGWRYRGKDDAASQLSYRSAFLARKAVDGLGNGETPSAPAKRRSASNPCPSAIIGACSAASTSQPRGGPGANRHCCFSRLRGAPPQQPTSPLRRPKRSRGRDTPRPTHSMGALLRVHHDRAAQLGLPIGPRASPTRTSRAAPSSPARRPRSSWSSVASPGAARASSPTSDTDPATPSRASSRRRVQQLHLLSRRLDLQGGLVPADPRQEGRPRRQPVRPRARRQAVADAGVGHAPSCLAGGRIGPVPGRADRARAAHGVHRRRRAGGAEARGGASRPMS